MQLVILERDGVINVDAGSPMVSEHDWQPIEGSLEALARLSAAGFRIVVASNQPGLRRRVFNIETLNAIHHRMQRELLDAGGGVDAVFFCSCLPKEACDCMMPSPGMLLEIATRLRISLEGVPVIGSSMPAMDAALAAGARPILVSADEPHAQAHEDIERFGDLAAAVERLLEESAGA